MIDNKAIKKASKQYLERKVKLLNKKLVGTGTIKLYDLPQDGRIYSGWFQEDKAFSDGAKWALKKAGVEQLLMEIVKLKEELAHKKEFSVQCQMAARTLQRKLRYQKYKRCEAMVEPMPLKLTEKSKQIIAQRFFAQNDVVEVVVKTKDGQTKTFVKEAK